MDKTTTARLGKRLREEYRQPEKLPEAMETLLERLRQLRDERLPPRLDEDEASDPSDADRPCRPAPT